MKAIHLLALGLALAFTGGHDNTPVDETSASRDQPSRDIVRI